MPNIIQKMFGVEPDGVSSATKKGIKDATEGTPAVAVKTPAPTYKGAGGVDPRATVVLTDGRRITPESNAVLEEMLRKRDKKLGLPQATR